MGKIVVCKEVQSLLGRNQQRPSFTIEGVRKIASELFGVEGAIRELPSERDQNFRITTESGADFVLKISASSEDLTVLDLQNKAMLHITQKGYAACPVPISSKSNELIAVVTDSAGQKHFVRLLSYLSGRLLANINPHSKQLLQNFGKFMGRVSHSLKDFKHPAAQRDFYWDLKNSASVVRQHKDLIADEKEQEIVNHFL
ncbi:hypothetical protein EU522_01885, partial [Candidatus Thorarchaeota archaeon]